MSLLAERNVIGFLLMDQKNIEPIYGMLNPEMFCNQLLSALYLEFLKGYDRNYEVNTSVIFQKIQSENLSDEIIGAEIKECVMAVITGSSIKSHAEVIVKDYKARKMKKILEDVKIQPDEIDFIIGKTINDLEGLIDKQNSQSKSLAQIAKENKDKYFCDKEAAQINLGFSKLDNILGGLEGGDMIVIGARPAVGKSAFVTQISDYFLKQNKRVGFYNLEMQEKQMYERFLVLKSGLSLTRVRRAKYFLGGEKEIFDKANEELEKSEKLIISTGSKSVSDIWYESRHMKFDVIIIDYLQLLKTEKEYRGNRTAEVGAISKAIKAMAMEFNIPIIALSQLNRVSEGREFREPTMAELREAGDIEQDASVVILMWNLSQDNRSKKGCKVEKQRQGETGKVVLDFDGDFMRFEESEESVKEAREWVEKIEDDCPFN